MRTLRKIVVFDHPFSIPGIDGEQPPGRYAVSTDEEDIGGLSFNGWRRTETAIRLPAIDLNTGFEQVNVINPTDLDEALKRDAQFSGSLEF
jgi:hypothetical protein